MGKEWQADASSMGKEWPARPENAPACAQGTRDLERPGLRNHLWAWAPAAKPEHGSSSSSSKSTGGVWGSKSTGSMWGNLARHNPSWSLSSHVRHSPKAPCWLTGCPHLAECSLIGCLLVATQLLIIAYVIKQNGRSCFQLGQACPRNLSFLATGRARDGSSFREASLRAVMFPSLDGRLPWVRGKAAEEASSGEAGSSPGPAESQAQTAANALYEEWERMYGLSSSRLPPATVPAPATVPPGTQAAPKAPHLEECVAVEEHRRGQERGGEQGGLPPWTCPQEVPGGSVSFCDSPHPPWVRGADEDNLPLTRVAQRDLWVHQFPRSCSDPSLRFLIARWYPTTKWGVGSQLHLMTSALSLAVASGRILVPVGYARAGHPGCAEHGRNDTLECYFFPVTPRDCLLRAKELQETQGLPHRPIDYDMVQEDRDLIASAAPVIFLERYHTSLESNAADRWIQDWSSFDAPFEMGRVTVHQYKHAKVNWWRAQAVRFMLRWPSAYLCHITNRVRNQAYGRQVALNLAQAALATSAQQPNNSPQEAISFAGEASKLGSSLGPPLEETDPWRFPREPYMPRPIVSVHVRQGDKGQEMKLFEFEQYMLAAQRVRFLDPGIHTIWLSTEMESVVNATSNYPDWDFYYSRGVRQNGDTAMKDYEGSQGFEEHVGKGYANLLIASHCDFFVGVLGSNWNRLLNELRSTGGRLKASYVALNNGEY